MPRCHDKDRRPWQILESGPESAIYRTADGGDTWQRLGGGLPTGEIGRIGLDIYQKDPLVLYALIENQNPKPGAAATEVSPIRPLAAGIIGNQLYRTDDGGATWRSVTDVNVAGGKAPYSFNQIRIDPHDDRTVIVTSDSMYISRDGGRRGTATSSAASSATSARCGGTRRIRDRIILGSDGGVSVSVDGGRTGDYSPNMGIGEAYAVGVDMDDPYHVYAGFQDHDSWKGPEQRADRPRHARAVGHRRARRRHVQRRRPDRQPLGLQHARAESARPDRSALRRALRIAPTRAADQPRLRFNWIAPIALSPHDPRTLYAGAQVLFRSPDRGDTWDEISPDLTTNDPAKIGRNVPVLHDYLDRRVAGPRRRHLGRDRRRQGAADGGSRRTVERRYARAGGRGRARRPLGQPRVCVAARSATAFVAKNGFRNDDFAPYLYRTTDYGRTWTSLAANLPASPINVVVQDRRNPHLLIVGNDVGVFVSIDDGGRWSRLDANLPTVAVHDLTIHPRENDLVVATYGRALWTGDITPLQELSADVLGRRGVPVRRRAARRATGSARRA